jgi:hypothetical protein
MAAELETDGRYWFNVLPGFMGADSGNLIVQDETDKTD